MSTTKAKAPIEAPVIMAVDTPDPAPESSAGSELFTFVATPELEGRPAAARFLLRVVASTLLLNAAAAAALSVDIWVVTCNDGEAAARLAGPSATDTTDTLFGETPAAIATAPTNADRRSVVKFANGIGRPTTTVTANGAHELEEFAPASEKPPSGQGVRPLVPPMQ